MTNEFKNNLLNYVCDNLPSETGNDNLQIENEYQVSISNTTNNKGIRLKDENGNYNGLVMVWNSEVGYQINDYNGNYISSISTYDSGDPIDQFDEVYVEDDGKLFAITSMSSAISPTHPREIIMLNNPSYTNSQGEYYLHIRKAYNISEYLPEYYTSWKIVKSPNESLYVISIQKQYIEDQVLYTDSGILTCKIQVGAENEYNTYYGALLEYSNLNPYLDSIVKFNEDGNIYYKVLLSIFGVATADNHNVYEYEKDFNDDTLSLNGTIQFSTLYGVDAIYVDENNIYGILRDEETAGGRNYYAKFKPKQGTFNTIELLSTGRLYNLDRWYLISDLIVLPVVYDTSGHTKLYVFKKDIKIAEYTFTTTYDYGDATQEIQLLVPLIYNEYNLYNVIVYMGLNHPQLVQFVYNINRYNGSSYTSYKSLVADSGILRDNKKIVFARDLYNQVQQQSTITSTIDIPNLMLNNEVITKEQLISMNNNIIDDNNKTIEKNIYEEILVNFNDTINIVDNNDNLGIINQSGSNQLVSAILDIDTPGYDAKPLGKYRIYHKDNSVNVVDLPTPTITNNIAEYQIVFGANKGINRIELISNDETLIYLTYTVDIEPNKVYKISQKVRVN